MFTILRIKHWLIPSFPSENESFNLLKRVTSVRLLHTNSLTEAIVFRSLILSFALGFALYISKKTVTLARKTFVQKFITKAFLGSFIDLQHIIYFRPTVNFSLTLKNQIFKKRNFNLLKSSSSILRNQMTCSKINIAGCTGTKKSILIFMFG